MSEQAIQKAIVEWLWLNEDPAVWDFFHVPMNPKSPADGRRLKELGAKAGVSDLVLDLRGRIIYVEVKTATGKMSGPQNEWRKWAGRRLAAYHVVRSVDDMQALFDLLGIPVKARAMPSNLQRAVAAARKVA